MKFRRPFLEELKKRTSGMLLYIQVIALIGVFLIILVSQIKIDTIRASFVEGYAYLARIPLLFDEFFGIKYQKKISNLSVENIMLRYQLEQLKYLAIENSKIKEFANYKAPAQFNYISTRAFFRVEGDLYESILLNAGNQDGIKKYSTVINSDGLVGIITEVGPTWSRALTLFNKLLKIPVILPDKKLEAIITGAQDGISFEILSEDKNIPQEGTVITSGRCVHIPEGIIVGKIEKGQLKSSVNFKKVDYVIILTRKSN